MSIFVLTNQDTSKLLRQLEQDFKRSVSWDRYVKKRYQQGNINEFNLSIDSYFLEKQFFC